MSDTKEDKEIEVVEAEIVDPGSRDLSQYHAKPLKVSKTERRINVTKVMNEMGFNPAETLIMIAQNRWEELGLSKPITAHEINSAASTLFHATVPNLKPIEYNNPEEEIKAIPVFVDKRGIVPRRK